KFLEDLKEAEGEATKTANCFLHHDSGFSVYNEYCQNYPTTMEVLGQLTRDEKMAALFREKQIALGHALPLGSYLLKPVQRILKYHLLLQRLSKQCDPLHKPAVDLALTTMTGIASDINNMKRKHEHAVRVQEIQAQLYGWNGPDLTALGELIAEGTFRVVGARGRRHVFLFEKVLLLAKNKQGGALAYKSHIMVSIQDVNNDKWSPLKQNSTPHYLERRSRVRKTRDFSNRRAASQDRTFPTLANWRRKSEPSMVPQYNPKKAVKVKKHKESQSATFYTDLSDSENCADESLENIQQNLNENTAEELKEEERTDCVNNNLEQIVSDILMQNQSFHKAFNRQTGRKTVTSDPSSVWCEEKVKLPTKADSLPRSFQLYDQPDSTNGVECKNERLVLDMSLKENPDFDVEEQQENDLSSQLDDTEHPDHKIYRKSTIRFSILQRIRHIMSEEQKRIQKYPIRKQGSKSMGEKIAHPDYVDPQKLFLGSDSCSQIDLSQDKNEESDTLGEPEQLDLTINEKDVLNELEKRLNGGATVSDTGQDHNSSHSFISSQSSDSYYEKILEDSLKEEYIKDSTGKLVAKQDSFSSNEDRSSLNQKFLLDKRPMVKRPTKAPPPIPQKPSGLSLNAGPVKIVTEKISTKTVIKESTTNGTTVTENVSSTTTSSTNSSWVKAMVGRFE
ncbi:unnamed protein product, partial [Diabrotica balteata]